MQPRIVSVAIARLVHPVQVWQSRLPLHRCLPRPASPVAISAWANARIGWPAEVVLLRARPFLPSYRIHECQRQGSHRCLHELCPCPTKWLIVAIRVSVISHITPTGNRRHRLKRLPRAKLKHQTKKTWERSCCSHAGTEENRPDRKPATTI